MPLARRRDNERLRASKPIVRARSETGEATVDLAGVTIVVTRAADRADDLRTSLELHGARVITFAATRIVPCDGERLEDLERALSTLARFDWVVFTSVTSVALTFDCAASCGVSTADWGATQIAVVGSATAAAVRERGLPVAIVPERFVAEGLLDAFASRDILHGANVLYPAASGARAVLAEGMRALGATVHQLPIYNSVVSDDDSSPVHAALSAGQLDLVTLTAASAVDAWVGAMAPSHTVVDAVTIGPVTTQAASKAGVRVVAEAAPSTLEGLVAAVVRAVQAQRERLHHQTPTPVS